MSSLCLIEYENNKSDNYWSGQIVSGYITITADKIEKVKAVTLKIKGCAHTSWEERSGLGDDKSTTNYTSHVDYIKTKTYLFGIGKDYYETDKEVIIEPGVYRFPIMCHIPFECPSSIEGLHGYIRYWVQVTFKRPWKFDKIFKKCFTVVHIHDLNLNGELKLPAKTDVTKHFCCGPCGSDPLQINVQLPQTGYVPGQLIPISILITNNTVSHINRIVARLVMIITYFSTIPKNSTSQTKTVSKLIGDSMFRNCKKIFNYLLPIPATPPTCTTLCSIIHITYRVEVEVNMQSILYRNQCINTPVTIGNVPLQMEGMVVQQQPLPKLNLEEITRSLGSVEGSYDPAKPNENIEPWSAFENIPAPVYLEATHMSKGKLAEDTDHEYGEKEFSPKYPVFDVPSPTSLFPPNADEIDGQTPMPSVATDPDKSTWL